MRADIALSFRHYVRAMFTNDIIEVSMFQKTFGVPIIFLGDLLDEKVVRS